MRRRSAVAKALDTSFPSFHRRKLSDRYRYLILDEISVRIRLVGKVQRRMVLCAYPFITSPFAGLATAWGFTNTLRVEA